ncbi:MAG: fibronectin type III domain-containing protein, partial [Bacteroidales bacterium]|nr:fibronectin type III domain-containing protein [Bacteroidales bacterium]
MLKFFTKTVCMALLMALCVMGLHAQELLQGSKMTGGQLVTPLCKSAVPLKAAPIFESGGLSRAPGDVALSYGFEDCTPLAFTGGWTANPAPGASLEQGVWSSVYGVDFGPGGIYYPYAGNLCAVIITYTSPAVNSWLFSNGVSLVSGTTYEISFMAYMGYFGATDYDQLRVRIGGTATEAGMEQTVFESGSNSADFNDWKKLTATFTPASTKTYYFGFQCYTGAGLGNYIFLDDIVVKEPADNELAIIAKTPYTKVPASQLLTGLSAKAVNQGANTQTGIELTATLGATTIGTASIPSLASGVTSADMNITNPIAVPLGNNTVTYTLTQDQIDDYPANNTAAFTVEGTADEYARDNGLTPTSTIGHTAPIIFGNTFTITDATTLTGAKFGYANFYPTNASDFTMSIYQMNSGGTNVVTPAIYTTGTQTKPSTPDATGWVDITFPDIALAPGSYFLCANQTGNVQLGLANDKAEGVMGYGIYNNTFYELNTLFGSTIGAPMIRMVVGSNTPPDGDCVVTIGNGTYGLAMSPTDLAFEYSYAQIIYDAADINHAPGEITAIAFEYQSDVDVTIQMQDIYMGNTTQSIFETTSSWVPVSGANLVLTNGTITYTQGWVKIEFATPFNYTGGNIVFTQNKKDNTYVNNPNLKFSSTSAPYPNCKEMHTAKSSGSAFDPTSLPTGGRGDYRPNAKFYFCDDESDDCDDYIVGTGTQAPLYVPFDYYPNYAQQIYLASEIGLPAGGMIHSIAYQFNSIAGGGTTIRPNQAIYMLNTTKELFDSNSDWVPIVEFTKVLEGTLTFDALYPEWVTIELDTPFEYTGDNLIVATHNDDPVLGSTITFYGTNVVYGIGLAAVSSSPTVLINPTSPPTGARQTSRSNTKFNICENDIIEPGDCNPPTNLTVAYDASCNAVLSWDAPAGKGKVAKMAPSSFATEYKAYKESGKTDKFDFRKERIERFAKLQKPVKQYAPASKSTIFFEDFNSANVPNLPSGWTQMQFDDSYGWETDDNYYYFGDVQYAFNDYGYDDGDRNVWMFTPGFTLTEGVTYNISFMFSCGWESGDGDDYAVKLAQSPTVSAMNSGYTVASGINEYTGWQETYEYVLKQNTFTPATTGTYYLGFHVFTPDLGGYCVAVDDVSVTDDSAPPADITYNLYRDGSSTPFWTGTTTTYTDSGNNPTVGNNWYVTAMCGSEESDPSNTATLGACTIVPGDCNPPTNLTAEYDAFCNAILTWDPPAGKSMTTPVVPFAYKDSEVTFDANSSFVKDARESVAIGTGRAEAWKEGMIRTAMPQQKSSNPPTRGVIFSEGFETSTDGNPPVGWVLSTTGSGDPWMASSGLYASGVQVVWAHSGDMFATNLYNGYGPRNAWMFSSGFTLEANTEYSISFWLKLAGYAVGTPSEELDAFSAHIGQGQTASAMTTTLYYNDQDHDVPDWTKIEYFFTPTVTGTYNLGFHAFTPADWGNDIDIDDILVVSGGPCEVISNLDANVTGKNVTLTWTAATGATDYDVFMNGSLEETVSGTTITFNNLSDGLYEFCVEGVFSEDCAPQPVCTAVQVGEMCNIHFEMFDDFGDGWNSASLTVQVNGTTYGTVTMPSSTNVYYLTADVSVPAGELKLIWNTGNYDCECEFQAYHPNGDLIYTSPANGSYPCGTSGIGMYGLSGTVYTGNFACTQTYYNVYRDDLLIAELITATTYTDDDFNTSMSHTWTVVQVCDDDVESAPVSITLGECVPEECNAMPSNLDAVYDDACGAILTWDAPTGGGSGSANMTLWDNTNINSATSGLISTYWTGDNNWVLVADDFEASGAWTIEKIISKGFISSGSATPTQVAVAIYGDDGGQPGTEIYKNIAIPIASATDPEIVLPSPFTLPGAGKYWIAIAGSFNVNTPASLNSYRWNVTYGPKPVGVNYQLHDPSDIFGEGTDWMDASGLVPGSYSMYFKLMGSSDSDVFTYNVYRDDDPTPVVSNYPATTFYDMGFDSHEAHTWYVTAICPNGVESEPIDVTLGYCKEPLCQGNSVIIGTGSGTTADYPIAIWYNNSISQQIFTAAEIGGVGTIAEVSFQYIHAYEVTKPNQAYYLGYTTKDVFANTSDWIPLSNLTQVYAGNVTYSNADTWVSIELDTPFEYNHPECNLVLAVVNQSAYGGNSSACFNISPAGGNKTLYWRDDGALNPSAPPTGTLSTNRANTRFHICDDVNPPSCNPPTNLAVNYDLFCDEATITWTPAVGAGCNTTYNIYRDNNPIATDIFGSSYADTDFDPTEGHTWEIETVCGGGEFASATVSADACAGDCDMKIVGTGTTGSYELPVNTYYSNSYTQQIFLANEIGEAGEMTAIAFRYIYTTATTKNPLTIYLGNTTKSVFSGTTDWVSLNDMQEVFSGSATFENGWVVIDFDESFEYTGCNLVVAVLNNNHGYNTSNNQTFYVSPSGGNRTLHYRNDASADIDPTTSITATGILTTRSNTVFQICDRAPYEIDAPVATAATNATCGSFVANWNTVDADCYLLSVYTIGSDQTITYVIEDEAVCNDNEYLVENLAPETTYYYSVKSTLACHESDASNEITVITLPEYVIIATAGDNGSIDPEGTVTIPCGTTSKTFTFTADACYSIDKVYVDNVEDADAALDGEYTFTDINKDYTIHVTFQQIPYTITATADQNGTIDPAGETEVGCGENQTYTITPNTCYEIDQVLIDNNALDGSELDAVIATGEYTFYEVDDTHTIAVTFKLKTYTITVTTCDDGTIEPAGPVTLNCGDSQTFNFEIDTEGYEIYELLIDGVAQNSYIAGGAYTFNNVTGDHSIEIKCRIITYNIIATAGPNGTIDPAGINVVEYDDELEVCFEANEGFVIYQVLVDGIDQPDYFELEEGCYLFENVKGNHTITVMFKSASVPQAYTITATTDAGGKITPAGTITVNPGANQKFTFSALAGYEIT